MTIMAKKIAFGSNHVVIDLPYGKTIKVHRRKDAELLKEKFQYLAGEFNMKVKVVVHRMDEPLGRGIGAVLETREAIRVLQQKENRPLDLEEKSLMLSSELLELCLRDASDSLRKKVEKNFGNSLNWAKEILRSGAAFSKMKEIIKAQGGNPNIDSEDLKPGIHVAEIKSERSGIVKNINIKNVTLLARLLGAPEQKGAGIFLNKKLDEETAENEVIYTMHSQKMYNLREAKLSSRRYPILKVA